MCLACRYNIPLTDFAKRRDNPVRRLFENELPVESAMTLFWFTAGTKWQRMIHDFKYRGRWLSALHLGEWMGQELRDSGNFEGIDLIVPIPLHIRRRAVRGFNQSEMLALGIGRQLGVECDMHSVRRCRYNDSQTSKMYFERWSNATGIFEVSRAERLRGRHILLVDDVVTTGATISSCAGEIVRACEGDVRISIATLSASRKAIGDER